jgi:hypothetical protein
MVAQNIVFYVIQRRSHLLPIDGSSRLSDILVTGKLVFNAVAVNEC